MINKFRKIKLKKKVLVMWWGKETWLGQIMDCCLHAKQQKQKIINREDWVKI